MEEKIWRAHSIFQLCCTILSLLKSSIPFNREGVMYSLHLLVAIASSMLQSSSEAAPASTEGRGQAHEGRQTGAWLTIL